MGGYDGYHEHFRSQADRIRKERRENTDATRETSRGLPRPDERYEVDEGDDGE